MLTDSQVQWLIFEGLVPIFGAGILYCAWGVMKFINTPSATASPFSFAWRESIDALGWLSGILIIATQAAFKSWDTPDGRTLSYWCIAGAGACFLLLLNAMNERGQDPAWKPPLLTKVTAFLLVMALLAGACRAQVESKEAKREDAAAPTTVTTQTSMPKERDNGER